MARSIVLCAGGTGGHLFPAQALAHELRRRGWQVHLATDRRAERFAGAFPAGEILIVPAATFAGRNPLAWLRAALTIWRGARAAHRHFDRIRPAAVVGFGGYPTLPALWAAARRGLPTLIHEQNAVMGRANRALADRVDRIAGGFLAPEGRHAAKILVTGNPVRPDILMAAATPYVPPEANGEFRLLVFGGSQGAAFFSELLPDAIGRLAPELRKRLRIVQQARPEDEAGLREAFAGLGIAAEVSSFFEDMAARLRDAHLVISRSGASTVSELAVIGRPALLVPYPHALDHDQAANAAALAAAGGAEVRRQQDLDGEWLAAWLGQWMGAPEGLAAMAGAARSAGHPDAARLLADAVEAIAAGESKRGGDTP